MQHKETSRVSNNAIVELDPEMESNGHLIFQHWSEHAEMHQTLIFCSSGASTRSNCG